MSVTSQQNSLLQMKWTSQVEVMEGLLSFHSNNNANIPDLATQLKRITLAWFAPYMRHIICAYTCWYILTVHQQRVVLASD